MTGAEPASAAVQGSVDDTAPVAEVLPDDELPGDELPPGDEAERQARDTVRSISRLEESNDPTPGQDRSGE